MSVIFEAPVAVPAEVREYRKRLTVRTTFVNTVPVRIAEIDEDRAPSAMTAVSAFGRTHDYREFDGGLLRSLQVPTEQGYVPVTRSNASEAIAAFVSMARNHASRDVLWPFEPRLSTTSRVTSLDQWQEVVQQEPSACMRATRDFWSRACCIGDVVYVPSLGPAWTVGQEKRLKNAAGVFCGPVIPRLQLVAERGHLAEPRSAWVYAPDQLAMAEIKMREGLLTQELRMTSFTQNDFKIGATKGSVHGPALRPEPGLGSLRSSEIEAALNALLRVSADYLGRMDSSSIHCYADMKAVSEQGIGADGPAHAMALVETFRGAWREVLEQGTNSYQDPRFLAADPVTPLLERMYGAPTSEVEPEVPAPPMP